MMSKYMQVVWLYLIGLVIIFIGIFNLMSSPGPSSFVIMLVGLGIAAVGAAHGRRMRAMGEMGMGQAVQEKPADAPEEEPEDHDEIQESIPEAREPQQGQPSQVVNNIVGRMKSLLKKDSGPDEIELTQDEIVQIESDDMKDGKIVPTEADVVEFVCPKCGAENEEINYYCFKCGNKLRKKPTEGGDEKITKVEPGAISLEDDKRVAKVVICPKCNVANKVGDKFCWNCGKKIKSEQRKKIGAKNVKEPELDFGIMKSKKKKARK